MIIRTENIKKYIEDKYTVVDCLSIVEDTNENYMYSDKRGAVHFYGAYEGIPCWKNLFSDECVDKGFYTDTRLLMDGVEIHYEGEFVCANDISDKVVLVDTKLASEYHKLGITYYLTDKSFLDSFKEMRDGEQLLYDVRSISNYSRLMMDFGADNKKLHISEFESEGMFKNETVHLNMGNRYIAFNMEDNQMMMDSIGVPVANRFPGMLRCVYHSKRKENDIINCNDTVKILNKSGYLYVSPFNVENEQIGSKVIVVANRKMKLEIYKEETEAWIELKGDYQLKQGDCVQLRILAEFGDVIKEVVIVR